MSNKETSPDKILEVIENTLEERTGRDRRKAQVSSPYLNPDLERRKSDRRGTDDQASE